MPTARELLEQADALMRRNRAAPIGREEPPPGRDATTIFPGGLRSPRTIQREPIASPIANEPAPGEPASAPRDAPVSPPVEVTTPAIDAVAEIPTEPEIPLLTDAVPEPTDFDASGLEGSDDDVPLLTDAVEEIDVGIVDESAHGEPSFWELTARGESSVLGRAPDSIVVVPPPELPPPGRDPLGIDQPAHGFVPSAEASAEADEAARRASDLPPLPALIEADVDEALTEAASVPDDEREPAFGEAAMLAEQAAAEGVDDAAAERRVAEAPMNDARIREVAEEIGMQVLQRIDIFADTTLRAQLGERLKPAVDRVSAELVAHINQQVGELLRAFVAEAIEREIENWRDRTRSR